MSLTYLIFCEKQGLIRILPFSARNLPPGCLAGRMQDMNPKNFWHQLEE